MTLKVVDFNELTSHLKQYVEAVQKIEDEKRMFSESIEPYKKELNSIISQSQSGLLVGNEQDRKERFEQIQYELLRLESEFKIKYNEMTSNLNETSFDILKGIIDEYALVNEIDMVMGKMEVVYNSDIVEITNEILEKMKEIGFYV